MISLNYLPDKVIWDLVFLSAVPVAMTIVSNFSINFSLYLTTHEVVLFSVNNASGL